MGDLTHPLTPSNKPSCTSSSPLQFHASIVPPFPPPPPFCDHLFHALILSHTSILFVISYLSQVNPRNNPQSVLACSHHNNLLRGHHDNHHHSQHGNPPSNPQVIFSFFFLVFTSCWPTVLYFFSPLIFPTSYHRFLLSSVLPQRYTHPLMWFTYAILCANVSLLVFVYFTSSLLHTLLISQPQVNPVEFPLNSPPCSPPSNQHHSQHVNQ